MQWSDSYYILKYNSGIGAFSSMLSLGSTSGISSNFKISVNINNSGEKTTMCNIKLTRVNESVLTNYQDIVTCNTNEIPYPISILDGRLEHCTGCSTCEKVCPNNCISMQENSAGFHYPVVKKEKCIHCGICVNRCPANSKPRLSVYSRPFVYAAYSKNTVTRKKSSSGGIFTEFARKIMEDGGQVFAATYNPFPKVAYSSINTIDEISFYHGSKYVESELRDIYKIIKDSLVQGKVVLFVGLPCHVGGLHAYLAKEYNNLITVDFVCGGVPSPLAFQGWINALENIYHEKITDYNFRCQTLGWLNNMTQVTFVSGRTKFIPRIKDMFYQDYQKGYFVRESCYHCHFYGVNSVADITIGDFNGAQNYDMLKEELHDGISVICVNSEKGNEFLQSCKNSIELKQSNFSVASRFNQRMILKRTEPEEREEYLKKLVFAKENIYSNIPLRDLAFVRIDALPKVMQCHTMLEWAVYADGSKEIEYAWYIHHNNTRIKTIWYSANNTLKYVPEEVGEYYITAFARYKDDSDKISIKSQYILVESKR